MKKYDIVKKNAVKQERMGRVNATRKLMIMMKNVKNVKKVARRAGRYAYMYLSAQFFFFSFDFTSLAKWKEKKGKIIDQLLIINK